MRHAIVLLACFALYTSLPSQGAANAALSVRTNSAEVATGMMMSFDAEAEVPASVEGSHFVLAMDDGGIISATVEPGDAPYLSLAARPGLLMDIFADQVARAEQMAQMFGGMMGMQSGMNAADLSQALDGLFSFPGQIDLIRIEIAQDPSIDFQIDASLQLTPKSGSWLGRIVGNATVQSSGLLSILDPKALVTFEANLDYAKLAETLRPLIAFSAQMSAKPGEDRKKAEQYMMDAMQASDGTFSMNFNPGQGGMVSLIGLRNAELSKKMLYGGAYAELYAIMQRKNRMIEFEIEPEAFEHRGVKVMKVSQFVEGMGAAMAANPFANADGSMTNFIAIAGDSMLMASAGAETGEMKHLIDLLSDQSLKRKTLGSNTLGEVKIRLGELAEFFSQLSGRNFDMDQDLPENVTAVIKKVDGDLRIEVSSK